MSGHPGDDAASYIRGLEERVRQLELANRELRGQLDLGEIAYSALAEVLDERVRVDERSITSSCGREFTASVIVSEAALLSGDRGAILKAIARTLLESLLGKIMLGQRAAGGRLVPLCCSWLPLKHRIPEAWDSIINQRGAR